MSFRAALARPGRLHTRCDGFPRTEKVLSPGPRARKDESGSLSSALLRCCFPLTTNSLAPARFNATTFCALFFAQRRRAIHSNFARAILSSAARKSTHRSHTASAVATGVSPHSAQACGLIRNVTSQRAQCSSARSRSIDLTRSAPPHLQGSAADASAGRAERNPGVLIRPSFAARAGAERAQKRRRRSSSFIVRSIARCARAGQPAPRKASAGGLARSRGSAGARAQDAKSLRLVFNGSGVPRIRHFRHSSRKRGSFRRHMRRN